MHQALTAILLLGVAAAAATLMATLAAWWLDPERRLRRALTVALGEPPTMALICPAAGQALALRLHRADAPAVEEALALAPALGTAALVFTLDELQGVELIFDGQVVARAFRGEGRRALDTLAPEVRQVALRLVFDDVREPEATLELYGPLEAARPRGRSAAEAVREGRLWLTRLEAVVRRPRG